MFGSSRNVILSTGLACVLALGAMGCSASVETTTKTEISTTDEEGTTTTTTTESTTGASTEDGVTSETTTETSTTFNISEWEDGWIGESDKGYKIFYAQAPQGTTQAMVVMQNLETNELLSIMGEYTVPDEGVVALTSASGNGDNATIVVTNQTAEGATFDIGSEFGKTDAKKVPFAEFLDELRAADPNHEVLE